MGLVNIESMFKVNKSNYITLEIAKKIKHLSYERDTERYWYPNPNADKHHIHELVPYNYSLYQHTIRHAYKSELFSNIFPAPTWLELIEWIFSQGMTLESISLLKEWHSELKEVCPIMCKFNEVFILWFNNLEIKIEII